LQAEAPEVFEQIKGGQPLSEESQNTLVEKTEEFKHSFQTTDGTPVVHDLDVDALSEDEIKKQTLKVKK
jgi:ATP synthase subunit alpha